MKGNVRSSLRQQSSRRLLWLIVGLIFFGVVYYNFRMFTITRRNLSSALVDVRQRVVGGKGGPRGGASEALSAEFRIEMRDPPEDVPVVRKRMMMYKRDGSGYLLQHPLNPLYWIDYTKRQPESASAWKADRAPRLGSLLLTSLRDVSLPQRKEGRMMLEMTPVGPSSRPGDWVEVGFARRKGSRTQHNLVCWKASGCEYDVPSKSRSQLRTIYKRNGGALQEAMDGQVWVESNSDGGPWLFFFGTVVATDRFILLLDASRDMWLKIKPPPAYGDEPYVASRVFMGESKNHLEEDSFDEDVSLEDQMKQRASGFSPWTLLFDSCDPKRTCRNVSRRIDAARKKAGAGPPLHLVFSVDGGKRYEWLALAFQFWWNRTQHWQTKGSTMTRLLSANAPDHLMDRIPTHVAPLPQEFEQGDRYLPYNKIVAVKHWIEQNHAQLPRDAIVVIMDVDIVLLEDLSYLAVNVQKGKPLGAKGFMSFTGEGSMYDKVVTRYCPSCVDGADPLAVPYFIHKDDLLRLAPAWYDMCRRIRRDTTPWSSVIDWRAQSPLQLSWTAEQWAYLLAASKLGLRHEVREDMSAFTSDTVQELNEPMIHFSDWTVGMDASGQKMKWSKGEDALKHVPTIDPARGAVNRAMIQALLDFRAAHYPHLVPQGK